MSSDNKMKGLLKGLRFISQIFDNNDKQQEIEIGHPTDVKHVAHIGWDGPSENPPGWMSEFKSVQGFSSAPLNMTGDIHCQGSDDPVKSVSSDTMKRGSMSVNHQSQEDITSKSSKPQSNSTGNMRECHAKEKSDRPRQPKRPSKHTQQKSAPNDSFNGSKSTEQPPIMHMDTPDNSLQLQGNNDLPPRNLPDKPRRSHSRKIKDAHGVGGGSAKSRPKAQPRDPNTNEEQPSRSRNKHRHSEDGQLERGSNENVLRNYPN